jgi:imidazole glycerol-phosphate synthase subunit HisH
MMVIVDYGVGNLRAIANMLKKTGTESIITNNRNQIEAASKLILPGVGAFDPAMRELQRLDLVNVLQDKVAGNKTPLLGICLGMQLLTKGSEEGTEKGLGWIPAYTYRFPQNSGLKVPHMGWSYIEILKKSPLTKEIAPQSKFYFVHSYFVKAENREHALLQVDYGTSFDAAIQHENIYGVQFHPEKSHRYGMKLLENFAKL